MELLLILLSLALLAGSVLGWVAFIQLQSVRKQLRLLTQQLKNKPATLATPHTNQSSQSQQAVSRAADSPSSPAPATATVAPTQPVTQATVAKVTASKVADRPTIAAKSATARSVAGANSSQLWAQSLNWLEQQLIQRGMVWLGGIAMALGGIFLVRHSLDAGWFTAELRLIAASLLGFALIAFSEWLHQHDRGQSGLQHYAPAAFAGAGFITLYATILTAAQFYQLLPLWLAFVLLAAVALAASWFALRQGPVLAVLGIVGAYAVPALVSQDSGNTIALLLYTGFVTTSSVLVEQRVRRLWLWYLPMAGHMLWLGLSFAIASDSTLWFSWLALGLSFALLVWWPQLGYRARSLQLAHLPLTQWLPVRREDVLGGLLLLMALLVVVLTSAAVNFSAMLLLMLLLSAAAFSHSRTDFWLWSTLLLAAGYLLRHPIQNLTDNTLPLLLSPELLPAQLLIVLLSIIPLLGGSLRPDRLHWHSMLAVAPVLMLGISYATTSPAVQSQLQPLWLGYAALLTILQALLSRRSGMPLRAFIHSAGANFALTFCLVLLLSTAALTIAIALQLVLITLLSRKQQLPLPLWLIKLLVGLLLLRLTGAAVLDSYQQLTLLGLHWSFVLYPVVLLCFVIARKLWQNTGLTPWLEGACLHVLALFVTVQTQYWLATGSPLYALLEPAQLSPLVTAVHACNWLLLAIVYLWRSALAGSLQQLYRIAAMALLAAAALMHGYLSLEANPFATNANLGSWLLWNQLLPLWGLPALLCFLCARLVPVELRTLMLGVATGFALLFITASIRHFWQDGSIGIQLSTSMAEHFSYSVVYLLLAIAMVLSAQRQQWHHIRKAGFVLLSLVTLKVFLFDLAGLSGVLRALSFIGLGFSLVLLSWWFQRSSARPTDAEADTVKS
ncbi:DUF2339 domain-containing protein [Alkalimonas collagenimarina]|uniref:DUF2339 domain-containing protein n=1 Tax=Alkalimonas collagenimarina TaxID=400390 RepID=A0ABT9GYX1_9GAMM|nr:DUF2339 domain-containing protein [Alkalimonas collagenimarina]MDP4536246.1 DUF2339 domain-containing protein [Alkalimonas collagenimarina]